MLLTVITIDVMFWLKVVSWLLSVIVVGFITYEVTSTRISDHFGALIEQILSGDIAVERSSEEDLDKIDQLSKRVAELSLENEKLKEELKERNND